MAQGDSLVSETAPLEMARRPSTPHRRTGSNCKAWPRYALAAHRYRGNTIPNPWMAGAPDLTDDTVESPFRGNTHGGFSERPTSVLAVSEDAPLVQFA